MPEYEGGENCVRFGFRVKGTTVAIKESAGKGESD